jgi:hypothetical protein
VLTPAVVRSNNCHPDPHRRAVGPKVALCAVAVGILLASSVLAREPGFGEYRAVRESLSCVHPRFRQYWLKSHGYDVADFTPSHDLSSDSLGLRLVGKYGRGPSVDVTGRDTLVALSLGSEVALINFAQPDMPQVLAEIQLDFMPAKSVLAGSLLIAGGKGMDIWNIADPTRPTWISRFPIGAGDFCVQDSLVCFIQTDSFRVYSIADPASPRLLGYYPDSGYVLTVSGNTVVVGEPSIGLYFVDISNPSQPKRVGTFASDYPLSADARGSLCCASFQSNGDPYPIRFVTLDISNPTSVRQLARIDSAGGYGVYIWDTLAFASGRDRAYAEEFQIIDIADSTHPCILGRGTTPYDNWGVWACPPRHLAYVADRGKGLSVFDITDLAHPVRDTNIMVADLAYDVAIDGNRAYVADWVGGLRVLDVSDPRRPQELGGRDSIESTCWTVVAKDSFAFIGWRPSPYFRSILVSDPTRPEQVGSGVVQTIPEDMVLRDTLVYLAGRLRFNVVNVARPRQPVLVGSCVTEDENSAGLWLHGDTAYLAGPYNGLYVIDVTDPQSPSVLKVLSGISAWGCCVRDSVLFVSDFDDSLHIWSVANLYNVYQLGAVYVSGAGHDVKVLGGYAYVGADGLGLVDISDLRSPRLLAYYSTPDFVMRVVCDSPHVYAACYSGGVCIFDTLTTGVNEGESIPRRAIDVVLASSPARDQVTVRIRNAEREEVMCNVYSVAGARVLAPVSVSYGGGCTSLRLDLRSASSGVYLLRVRVGKTVCPLRITKL